MSTIINSQAVAKSWGAIYAEWWDSPMPAKFVYYVTTFMYNQKKDALIANDPGLLTSFNEVTHETYQMQMLSKISKLFSMIKLSKACQEIQPKLFAVLSIVKSAYTKYFDDPGYQGLSAEAQKEIKREITWSNVVIATSEFINTAADCLDFIEGCYARITGLKLSRNFWLAKGTINALATFCGSAVRIYVDWTASDKWTVAQKKTHSFSCNSPIEWGNKCLFCCRWSWGTREYVL